ncbi:MAG: zinc transporter, family, partial [Nocardioidaceae bacterium]|nr:zinc transporter, family [Nocardioidaceae bacterium]
MSLTSTLLLGFVAGVTILLGLPIGRLRKPAPSLRLLLSATAVGILLFLVWDVLSGAWEPIDQALGSMAAGDGGFGTALGYGVIFAGGLAVGLLTLVYYERWMGRQAAKPTTVAPARPFGPGAMTVGELAPHGLASWSSARRLALMIALGIGLH